MMRERVEIEIKKEMKHEKGVDLLIFGLVFLLFFFLRDLAACYRIKRVRVRRFSRRGSRGSNALRVPHRVHAYTKLTYTACEKDYTCRLVNYCRGAPWSGETRLDSDCPSNGFKLSLPVYQRNEADRRS